MKNIKLPFSLFLCLIFLFTSTVSQAVTAPTSSIKTKIKTPSKKQVKLERLKQKLSKRMAKIKQKQKLNERAYIEKNSKRARGLAIISLVGTAFGGFAFLALTPQIVIFLGIVVSLLSFISFIFSGKTLKKIKNSSNPEQYGKSKKRASRADGLAIISLMCMVVLAFSWAIYYWFAF